MPRFSPLFFVLILAFFTTDNFGQDSLQIELVEDHNSWGWDAWVMSNDLITISTMPSIGARIMQYDLNGHPSIFVNPDELGNTYTPSSNSGWPNFGGFKNWPAPQDDWGWPPPPTLDFGPYEATANTSADSVSLSVTSPIEQWRTPDLRFKRRTTIYKNSSQVKVEQTIINEGDSPQSWSVWDVTQQIVNHPQETDFSNFRTYFPINPNSDYGADGVRTTGNSNAWMGEVADGIYGVKFRPDGVKLFTDTHIGWIAYTDERDGYVYAKTFDIDEFGDYPDEGARIEVWINSDPYYLETEVVSPIVELDASGGEYTFTENWWTAKISGGPVLSVTNAGAVIDFHYEDTGRLIGDFGVFYSGEASFIYYDNSGEVIMETPAVEVSPSEPLQFDIPFDYPEEADSLRLVVYAPGQGEVGTLVAESISKLITSSENENVTPDQFRLFDNYPNPFNPGTVIRYQLAVNSRVELKVFDMLGHEITVLVNELQTAGNHQVRFDATGLASGIYFYQIRTDNFVQTKKMLLVK